MNIHYICVSLLKQKLKKVKTKVLGNLLETKKTQLTDEDQLLIPSLIKKWSENMCAVRLDKEKAYSAIEWLYKKSNLPMPVVYFVDSPYDAVLKSWELRKLEDPAAKIYDYSFMANANVSDYGWLAYYELLELSGIETPQIYRDYMENYFPAGIYDGIAYEECIIVCDKPKFVKVDERGRMHCTTGHAVEWSSGWGQYYIHDRLMPAHIFETEITREMFMNESNADYKGGMYAILGQRGMLDLLGAEVVDSKSVVHGDGTLEMVELLKTKDIFAEIGDVPFAWVQQTCPTTFTTYLAGCEPHHTDAIEAKKSIDGFFPEEQYFYDTRS